MSHSGGWGKNSIKIAFYGVFMRVQKSLYGTFILYLHWLPSRQSQPRCWLPKVLFPYFHIVSLNLTQATKSLNPKIWKKNSFQTRGSFYCKHEPRFNFQFLISVCFKTEAKEDGRPKRGCLINKLQNTSRASFLALQFLPLPTDLRQVWIF